MCDTLQGQDGDVLVSLRCPLIQVFFLLQDDRDPLRLLLLTGVGVVLVQVAIVLGWNLFALGYYTLVIFQTVLPFDRPAKVWHD